MEAHVEVYYPAERNLPAWQEAHAGGALPDRWPYGLHQIAQPGTFTVSAAEAGRTLLNSSLRRFSDAGGGTTNRSAPDVALSWDENLAMRLYWERPRVPKITGVIWATDRVSTARPTAKDRLIRAILQRYDRLWVLSRPQAAEVTRWLGPACPPVDFLRFGIDESFFTPAAYPKEPLLLSAGGDRDRDPETLFAALARIKEAKPELKVVVQSRADFEPPPGVVKVAHLTHRQLRDLYQRASVVLVATRANLHVSGMTVALESMSTARPVVACRTPGMEDYVQDTVTGLLVAPADAPGMAEAVLQLLDNPEAAEEMGRKGRSRICTLHTTTVMSADLRTIIHATI